VQEEFSYFVVSIIAGGLLGVKGLSGSRGCNSSPGSAEAPQKKAAPDTRRRYHPPLPRSETHVPPGATMRWSRKVIPRSVHASAIRVVNPRSSALGDGSPEGYVWKTITPPASCCSAAVKIARGSAQQRLSVPRYSSVSPRKAPRRVVKTAPRTSWWSVPYLRARYSARRRGDGSSGHCRGTRAWASRQPTSTAALTAGHAGRRPGARGPAEALSGAGRGGPVTCGLGHDRRPAGGVAGLEAVGEHHRPRARQRPGDGVDHELVGEGPGGSGAAAAVTTARYDRRKEQQRRSAANLLELPTP